MSTSVMKAVARHPALVGAACAATGLVRQIIIKPYLPRKRHREFMLKEGVTSLHACRMQIFKEKGAGNVPTIVLGGFIPDATEQVEYQRALLREYGSIYYLNYPRTGFSLELLFAQLADLIEDLNNRDQRPVLFGVSFGCGVIGRFLQEYGDARLLRVRGVVQVSPVLCAEDLLRPPHESSSGARGVERILGKMLNAGAGNGEVLRQIGQARRYLRVLMRSLIGEGEGSGRNLVLKNKILQVIQNVSAAGAYQRVLALKQFPRADITRPIFAGPALVLLAEEEEQLLVPDAPTLAMLRSQIKRKALFPHGVLWTVFSPTPRDPVFHASLISHHHCYNRLIKNWYQKLLHPRLTEAA